MWKLSEFLYVLEQIRILLKCIDTKATSVRVLLLVFLNCKAEQPTNTVRVLKLTSADKTANYFNQYIFFN